MSPAGLASNPAARDVESREDLRRLVEAFYARLLADPRVAHHFAGLEFERHFDVLVDFWAMIVLGQDGYRGNTVHKHARLVLEAAHFDVWLAHFDATVDDHFVGPRADLAKARARTIAAILRTKLVRAPDAGRE